LLPIDGMTLPHFPENNNLNTQYSVKYLSTWMALCLQTLFVNLFCLRVRSEWRNKEVVSESETWMPGHIRHFPFSGPSSITFSISTYLSLCPYNSMQMSFMKIHFFYSLMNDDDEWWLMKRK
jgi:hypothetical protein